MSAQAIPYWQRAGQRAIERSANVEAISHLTKGLEVLKTLPDTPERTQQELTLQLALGAPLLMIKGHTAPEVEHAYTRAQELCQQVGDSPQRFSALVGLWRFYLNRARLQTARELAEQCFTLAQRLQDSALLQEAHVMLGSTLFYLGELVSARAHLEQGIALYDPQQGRSLAFSRGTDPGVVCLSRAGLGAVDAWISGSSPDQEPRGSQLGPGVVACLQPGFCLALCGLAPSMPPGGAVGPRAGRSHDCTFERAGFIGGWRGNGMRGWALAEQGSVEEGIEQLARVWPSGRLMGAELGLRKFLSCWPRLMGKEGKPKKGCVCWPRHWLQWTKMRSVITKRSCIGSKGSLHSAGGHAKGNKLAGSGRGEPVFVRAIEVARHQQAKSLELRAVMSLSRLWQQQGKASRSPSDAGGDLWLVHRGF